MGWNLHRRLVRDTSQRYYVLVRCSLSGYQKTVIYLPYILLRCAMGMNEMKLNKLHGVNCLSDC
jgi:hypothetical protein